MKNLKISIRYKILSLLALIPVVTLSLYLMVASQIFEDDKVAYVFDSSVKMSGTVAAQVKTQLNSILSISRPLFQDFALNNRFTSVSRSVFGNESNLEAVVVFTQEAGGGFKRVEVLEKVPNLTVEAEQKTSMVLAELQRKNRVVLSPFSDDRLYVFEKFNDEINKRSIVFMLVNRMSEMAEVFRSVSSQQTYLVNESGDILFAPESIQGKKLNSVMDLDLSTKGTVAQGAEYTKGAGGESLLTSFAKVGFGDLFIVTSVDRNEAMGALDVLLRKSLIFFGVLLSVIVIVSLLASRGLTQALTQLFSATQKISEGNFDIRVNVTSNDEVGALASNFNIMAQEVSRLLDQTAEQARMQAELETAKTVQETLFPEARQNIGPLNIAGFYEPASECGGDWWHYCQIGQKIFLWIGDATGHGAPAALITSAARSASSIIERLNITPGQALELLNRCIYDVSKGKIMMTFFLASFDLQTGELIYANASHEAPFLIKKGEQAPKKKDLIPLNEVNNPRLGQARDTVYNQTSLQLDVGDTVFFYTDGIPDIHNPEGEAWGERAFIKALLAAEKEYPSADQVVKLFVDQFQVYRQGATLVDDVTFFVVKREANA